MGRDLRSIIFDETADWDRKAGCDDAELAVLIKEAPVRLPDDYLEFLRLSNGGDGRLGVSPFWFSIAPAQEVIELNRRNEQATYYPDLYLFGQCDGNLFAFDLRHPFPWPLVAIDYLDSRRECVDRLGATFTEFVAHLGRSSSAAI
jgi:hypothetical protein